MMFLLRRLLYMVIVVFIVSIVGFIIIQLPPGDFLSTYIMRLEMSGQQADKAQIESLRKRYGLDLPIYVQYLKWVWGMFHGDFGVSFGWNLPVKDLISERLVLTLTISLFTLFFAYSGGMLIGIYSATHQYSISDSVFTIFGFIGLATPNFLLALILMYFFFKSFGVSVVGLFSPKYVEASWSIAKFVDMLQHLPIPVIVISTAAMAGIQRTMRACLLDEMAKQYVVVARAKGMEEKKLLFKYPVRVALNPIVSNVGWMFPQIISGGAIVAMVLGLPTVGPLLLKALKTQDMYLAGALMTLICVFAVVGLFISDILLMLLDPRIKRE